MDRLHRPSAKDLGVTEIEYERIIRGLRERQPGLEPTVAPTPVPTRPAAALPGRRRLRAPRVLLAAAVLLLGLATRHSLDSPAPAYAFLDSTPAGLPVTYSSCKQLPVAVYPAGGPAGAETLVREAVRELRSATGLDIVVRGVFGGHAPNWNFEVAPVLPDDPVSVSWQDGTAISQMTDDVAGLGRSRVMPGRDGSRYLVAGTIALSRDYYALLQRHQDHAEELAVLLHEFGHVLGLDHVDSAGELMYHDNVGRTTFGPGDLEGLRRLGKGPCV